jgi:hypothetical protein
MIVVEPDDLLNSMTQVLEVEREIAATSVLVV